MDRTTGRGLILATMSERSTTDLLAAAAGGDSKAWATIVDRYERLVWSVVRSYRLDSAAASDVCQTVWLRLVENCERIRQPERLPSWLCATARNEALRTVRAQKRTIPSEFEYDIVDEALPDPDAAILQDERLGQMVAAFQQLSPDCQQLLRLLVTDPPLDYDVVAELIDRPKGSIGPTRARCLEKLRRIMERRDGTSPGEKGLST